MARSLLITLDSSNSRSRLRRSGCTCSRYIIVKELVDIFSPREKWKPINLLCFFIRALTDPCSVSNRHMHTYSNEDYGGFQWVRVSMWRKSSNYSWPPQVLENWTQLTISKGWGGLGFEICGKWWSSLWLFVFIIHLHAETEELLNDFFPCVLSLVGPHEYRVFKFVSGFQVHFARDNLVQSISQSKL